MTTLASLKSRIADDLARPDLTTQIANEITSAIQFYQNKRFYFNETRSSTFVTVATQARYTSSDDADIPLFFDLDCVFLEDTNSQTHELSPYGIDRMEHLQDNSASSGEPYAYLYHAQTFTLYPIPDAVYTVRPIGAIVKAVPASDAETGNVWMTEAYELIRCRAKRYLAAHVLRDLEMAQVMGVAESEALMELQRRNMSRMTTGTIEATSF